VSSLTAGLSDTHSAASQDIRHGSSYIRTPSIWFALLPSWELAVRAERKSPATLKVYGDGVFAFFK
jgi:hypothetical protein